MSITEHFDSLKKISYSRSCTKLSPNRRNRASKWREGMVSGNGMQGVVTSGAPYSDSFIFQNMHFIMPNCHDRITPDTSFELEEVKRSIIDGRDIIDKASYDDVYYFHPGGALRLEQKQYNIRNYYRYTNYSTAEVGVHYTNSYGQWERTTFTSQADGVNITRLESSDEGKALSLTLSFDAMSSMANYGAGDEAKTLYKHVVNNSLNAVAQIVHYPSYEKSELKNGGYATLTYIICEGGKKELTELRQIRDKQYAGKRNPAVKITDAKCVTLISLTGRTSDMGDIKDFAGAKSYALFTSLYNKAEAVAKKYTVDSAFDYNKALNNHLRIYTPLFSAVDISLTESESKLSNDSLLALQKNKKELKSELMEKLYYSGRYAYLCCCGYSTSRLAGLWTGEFNPGWGSKFTMDANVNLQTSSMNSGNIASAPVGYTFFILRQVAGWEQNAEATHGFKNAIQAPVHTDGDCSALTETCYAYPFRYWNAGASWMLQPLFETLETYGNIHIPLSEEYDLNKLTSVLSITQEDIAMFKKRGYLELERDILLPLLTKSANYWEQLMTPEYYTDGNGNIHFEDGKSELGENEYYCILPSYSPENNPSNYPSPSDANCAIDISACRDNLRMLIKVMRDTDENADTQKWEKLLKALPPYLFDETGVLKEWACNQFKENNEHRHLSHLYCVWPLDETQKDEKLRQACIQAIDNRESENAASHALVHRSLIAARLKDRKSLSAALLKLVNNKIHYNSLLTNHNYDQRSAYCTDFAIGYLGIINESLVYSNPNEIEALPALPESGFNCGEINGLRTRTRALVTSLKWNLEKKTASLTVKSDIAQKIELTCPLSGEKYSVSFTAGEEKTVEFTLN